MPTSNGPDPAQLLVAARTSQSPTAGVIGGVMLNQWKQTTQFDPIKVYIVDRGEIREFVEAQDKPLAGSSRGTAAGDEDQKQQEHY